VKLGRLSKLTPEQRREAIKRRDEGEETRAEIARRYNVPRARFRGSPVKAEGRRQPAR